MLHATRDTGHTTRDTRHGTRDTGHTTRDTGQATHDTGHGTLTIIGHHALVHGHVGKLRRVPLGLSIQIIKNRTHLFEPIIITVT